jgi:hypothetical protein
MTDQEFKALQELDWRRSTGERMLAELWRIQNPDCSPIMKTGPWSRWVGDNSVEALRCLRAHFERFDIDWDSAVKTASAQESCPRS